MRPRRHHGLACDRCGGLDRAARPLTIWRGRWYWLGCFAQMMTGPPGKGEAAEPAPALAREAPPVPEAPDLFAILRRLFAAEDERWRKRAVERRAGV